MGFFSDLKEDLNQAATELITDEEKKEEQEVTAPATDTVIESALDEVVEEKKEEKAEEDTAKKSKATDENAVISVGMSISGDVVSSGSMDLLGEIKGNITLSGKLNILGTIEGDSKAAEVYAEDARIIGEIVSEGSVKVGKNTVIIGNLFATSAVIAGAVKGDIDVKGPVVLDTTAIVMGNIKSKSVQINNGAVIEGICSQCYADVSPTSFFDEFKKAKK